MASIYELTGEFQLLYNLMESGELEEEALKEALEVTKEELAIKLEGYCKFIKNLESDAAGLKAEEERLAKRRKTIENTITSAKKAMLEAVRASGADKPIKCGTFTVGKQKNPPSVVIDESYIENIPEKYLKQAEPSIDKKAIGEALKAGGELAAELEGIAHLETSERINIR